MLREAGRRREAASSSEVYPAGQGSGEESSHQRWTAGGERRKGPWKEEEEITGDSEARRSHRRKPYSEALPLKGMASYESSAARNARIPPGVACLVSNDRKSTTDDESDASFSSTCGPFRKRRGSITTKGASP